jgi:hypothetical protein
VETISRIKKRVSKIQPLEVESQMELMEKEVRITKLEMGT